MNDTTNSVAGALTRHTLTAGGVAGLATAQDDILKLISLLVTIIGLVWSIWEKMNRKKPDAGSGSGSGVNLLLCGLGAAWLLSGCAVVRSTQTDRSPNEREITTKVTGYALFSSAQTLQKLTATTTDKTQSFGLAGLSQHGATNTAGTISELTAFMNAIGNLNK